MAKPLRHRQTKEAETDMHSLMPPRHIPTLPKAVIKCVAADLPIKRAPVSTLKSTSL